VIDDHSKDNTLQEINKFSNIRCISQDPTHQGKKKAIEKGIRNAKYNNIITLDGDCTVGDQWVRAINDAIEEETSIATGIVNIGRNNKIISEYEYLDTLATMTATSFGIKNNYFHLGNGCNLFFKKDLYQSIQNDEAYHHYASGDDVFLMKKAAEMNQRIKFIGDPRAVVLTNAQASYQSLFQQRKRWSTKTRGYANNKLLTFQVIVFMTVFMLVLSIFFGLWKDIRVLYYGITALVVKMIIDYIFLAKSGKSLYQLPPKKGLFIQASLLSMVLMLYMGMSALLPKKYMWKGREVA
jgi:glycosyltransferase involved in cell wall biosynthesis